MSSEVNILLEKATSPLLLDIDWDSTLQIVDLIRQGDVNPKSAVQSVLNRLKDTNPNVVLLALQVLESVVKNCGQSVHEHVASRAVMEQIHDILRTNPNEEVRKKILLLLATWVYAFRNEVKYRAVQDIVNILRAEGFHMPQVSESDAMFTADRAPDWADGECCHRCRSQFTMIRRKHHCRACGQVFCGDCSSKSSTIPKFGIERDVRVCESCFEDINNAGRQSSGIDTLDREGDILADKQRPSNANAVSPATKAEADDDSNVKPAKEASDKKSAEELQEEEELQLALALSKSEAENKEKEKLRATSSLLGGNWRQPSPTPPEVSPGGTSPLNPIKDQDMDPELARYLNRSYWEQQQQQQQKQPQQKNDMRDSPLQQPPSAPITSTKIHSPSNFSAALTIEKYQNGETEELGEFVSTLKSSIEIFVNRMKSNQSRGRPIANDTSVQSLFMNITAMHAQLLKYIHLHDERRVRFELLQDKISQVRDARAALEALREEHRERLRREREEQERIRQIQMMQKLEIMRKKKQEYLEYQRQLAMHRMAECEREIYGKGPGGMGPGGPGGPGGMGPGGPGAMPPPGGPNMPPAGGPGFPHMPYQPYTGPSGQIGGFMYSPEGNTPQGAAPPGSHPFQQSGPGQQQPQQQGPGPNYQPPPSGHVMPPPAGQPPPPHNYDPYSMAAMANSLPPTSAMAPGFGPPPGHPQGPPVGGMAPGGGPPQMAPGGGPPQMAPPGPAHQMPPGPAGQGQPTQPAAEMMPPPQLPPVPSPQDQQAELISFD